MTQEAGVPLYATQGGGYATYSNATGKYVWHSDIPDFLPGAKVGDPIPAEWSVVSINAAAHREVEEADRYDEEDDDYVTTSEVYHRAYAHFGNHEMADEAARMYPGDFI